MNTNRRNSIIILAATTIFFLIMITQQMGLLKNIEKDNQKLQKQDSPFIVSVSVFPPNTYGPNEPVTIVLESLTINFSGLIISGLEEFEDADEICFHHFVLYELELEGEKTAQDITDAKAHLQTLGEEICAEVSLDPLFKHFNKDTLGNISFLLVQKQNETMSYPFDSGEKTLR